MSALVQPTLAALVTRLGHASNTAPHPAPLRPYWVTVSSRSGVHRHAELARSSCALVLHYMQEGCAVSVRAVRT